jgi:hypothetical protein
VKPAIRNGLAATAGVLLAISALSAGAGNTHYRWLDERGNPVHSDRPPPKGIDYEVISSGTGLKRPVEASEGAVPAKLEPGVGNEFQPQNETEQVQVMKKNPEYCQRARENLNTLNTSARIRVRDEQGEFRFLDEEEKEARRQEARDAITRHCP